MRPRKRPQPAPGACPSEGAPLRLNLSMGRGLGWLFYHLAKRRRQIAATNIRLCFPELDSQAQAKMLRNIISNVGISFF